MWNYRICGLEVASDFELPGAIVSAAVSAAPDVTLRRAAVPDEIELASARGPNWAIEGERFLLRVPGVARFLMTAGREVLMQVEPRADERDALIFLVGSAFGVLLHQRGRLVLHGSGVRVDDHAILFCGPSGAGKSTLAAALEARGYDSLNDDLCCLAVAPDAAPRVEPEGKAFKLWADTVNHLDVGGRKGSPVRAQISKYYVETARTVPSPAVPVRAIYVLREERPPNVRGIQPTNLVEAAQILRRNTYRSWLVQKMGRQQAHFADSLALQRHVPIFRLTRPTDLALLPEVISWLETHWTTQGLRRSAA